jgi:hypothetical protein
MLTSVIRPICKVHVLTKEICNAFAVPEKWKGIEICMCVRGVRNIHWP